LGKKKLEGKKFYFVGLILVDPVNLFIKYFPALSCVHNVRPQLRKHRKGVAGDYLKITSNTTCKMQC